MRLIIDKKKRDIFVVLLLILLVLSSLFMIISYSSKRTEDTDQMFTANKGYVRKSAVAGSFYKRNADDLKKELSSYFYEKRKMEEGARIIIVPHAGTIYSGETAAIGFSQIDITKVKTAIVLGVSHENMITKAAVISQGQWETPLGNVPVNSELAERIINGKNIVVNPAPHEKEHSIELEVIFLKYLIDDIKIVPILLGQTDIDLINSLAYKIAHELKDDTILIISTDLSHYPNGQTAKIADTKIINAILTGKETELINAEQENRKLESLSTSACGFQPLRVALKVAEYLKINDIRMLDYRNSGQITGDNSKVVGYTAVGFFSKNISSLKLSEPAKKEALEIARKTLLNIFEKKSEAISPTNPELNYPAGAFVTLNKNNRLRGCIGHFNPEGPLYKTIQNVTVSSALEDPRFNPVKKEELDDIKIEISVMSPDVKIDNWEKIEFGKQGVRLELNGKTGTFLPQVASDNNWDLETFLKNLCSQKLGEDELCYKNPKTSIYTYETDTFSEEDY